VEGVQLTLRARGGACGSFRRLHSYLVACYEVPLT
jgi:hypothetical protein